DARAKARRRRRGENGSGLDQGANPLARALLFLPCRVSVALRYGRRELHSLADAGAELRPVPFDERPVDAPDLPRLNDAKTFAPGIEAVGSDDIMHRLRAVAAHRLH